MNDNVIQLRPAAKTTPPPEEPSPGLALIKRFEEETYLNALHGLEDNVQLTALVEYVKFLEIHYKRTT